MSVGSISFHLHTSGDRVGVRIRDTDSALRRRFAGLRWFSINRQWSIEGRFVPYESPREVTVPNVLGDFERLTQPGEVVFKVDGRELRLQAAQAGRRLWFIFSDRLGGRDTHHIRFLYSDAPDEHGRVGTGFQPRLQSAVRVQPVHHVPAAAAAEPAGGGDRRRRADLSPGEGVFVRGADAALTFARGLIGTAATE